MTVDDDRRLHRIHILGTSGTGKTTLSRRLGEILGIPVYHLDEIGRVGGGRGPLRSEAERARDVGEILATPEWVTEGIQTAWTDPLLERAQLIVWLDHVPKSLARRRIIGRFLRDALAEARHRRGRERFLRVRDYAAHVQGLVTHLRTIGSDGSGPTATPPDETRAAMEAAIRRHGDRVEHCQTAEDVESLVKRVKAQAEASRARTNSP